ncbi:MAG: hypothetical protein H6745_19400 [Deltaproteobacteria bacterium]|nr:hypothetical protein [Deltaproteobacteria bacterium]
MTAVDARLEEAVLTYLFGDGEEDPGLVVVEGAKTAGFLPWLDRLEQELAALAHAVEAPLSESVALARLGVLREETKAWAARAAATGAAAAGGPAEVVSLAAARERRRGPAMWVGAVVAIAAAVLIAVALTSGGGAGAVARPSVAQAQQWAGERVDKAMAFSGATLTAADRGFLLGIVRDLSAPRADGSQPTGDELEAARAIAAQAFAGTDVTGDPEALRKKALAGCAAFGAGDAAGCEEGVATYARHRDAALGASAPK